MQEQESRSQTYPRATLTGDFDRPEFADAVARIKKESTCTFQPSIDHLIGDSRASSQHVFVIFESFPRQQNHDDVQRLKQENALTPIVIVAGSWCEGELRSGSPPEGILRFYQHQFAAHWERFVQQFTRLPNTEWHWPGTMSRADRLLERPPTRSVRKIRIGVLARQKETAAALIDACHELGFNATSYSDCSSVENDLDVLLIDDDGFDNEDLFVPLAMNSIPRVINRSYPRIHQMETAVYVSKPMGLIELKYAIESACP